MNKKHNLDKAFQKFFENLQISEQDRQRFLEVRRTVRQNLRKEFAEIKFLTQGSFAYHTLINLTQCPPQQMDLDDGAYFTYFRRNYFDDSKLLFDAIDPILDEIASENSWKVDTSKVSCGRLIVAKDKHIDIPLYRIEKNGSHDARNVELVNLYRKAGIPYYPSSERVLLAQRTGEWIVSDPRSIIEWVLYCVSKYGQQFLRLCCYFKAWRDCQWAEPPIKSILIMAMLDAALDYISSSGKSMDDACATYECAMHMIKQLKSGGVKDPSDNSKILDGNLNPSQRHGVIEKLGRLADTLEKSLYDSGLNVDDLCELLCDQFGRFFPCDPDLLESCQSSPNRVTPIVIPPVVVPTPRPWAE